MVTVEIIEKYDTSMGLTLVVPEEHYSVGDMICDKEKNIYKIERIAMPTRPQGVGRCALIVKEFPR